MIQHRLGFSFAVPIVIVGVVITLAGILAAIESPILGIVLVLVGPFFWSGLYGTQIDKSNNRFREYGSMYGVKSGQWKPLDKMPYLTVLKGKSGMTVYSRSNRSTSIIDDRYEVCLLNQSHRTRTTVKKFETKQEAMNYCTTLADDLNKEVVMYNPAVSEKTRSRRMSK
ncbi:MAG: hypothetical protein QNK23_14130 [Crocinitomicaceae bacterium]|nr:hypothetical protein [Crocinitomicaceae bacterium]